MIEGGQRAARRLYWRAIWPKPNKDSVGELLGSEGQRRQGCGSSLLGAWISQPRDDPYQVDCGGNQDVLEMRFRQAEVA